MNLRSEDISVGSFEDAARAATGTAVIIDVFRAFTTAAVALANRAEKIVMVGDLDEARALRDQGVGRFCMGERGGDRPEGFDFGNSPAEIAEHRFDGVTLIQTTSNGTRGILAARKAKRIYAASFATARATAAAILGDPVLPVSLVAMGDPGPLQRDEDEVCALYLRALLCGRTPDASAVAPLLTTMSDLRDTRRLSDADVSACLRIDRVDFAVAVERHESHCIARATPADRQATRRP